MDSDDELFDDNSTIESDPAAVEQTSAAVAEKPPTPMMERLMELELPLTVALGRAVLPLYEILKMSSGSLIELDRTTVDWVDLMVHGTIVARGEIVSVKGNYGVRIKEIISKQDRLALKDHAT